MRTRQEINQEYSNYASILGDRVYKNELAQSEILELKKKVHEIAREKASDDPAPVEAAQAPAEVPAEPPASV